MKVSLCTTADRCFPPPYRCEDSVINIASMADADDLDEKNVVFHGVDDAVVALPYPVCLLVGQLDGTVGAGVVPEGDDSEQYALPVLCSDFTQCLSCRGFELDLVFHRTLV